MLRICVPTVFASRSSPLAISPNTVGTQIRSIYAKLGVADRSAAVRRARELRLLGAVRG